MDDLKRYGKKLAMRAMLFPLRILPVKKNRVFLINDLAYNYSDNPKFVADYLQKNYPGEFELVFGGDAPADPEVAKNIQFVKRNSLQYFVKAMTARVLLTNSGGFSYLPLRKKKQYVINTWHGGGAYKKCGIDMYVDTPYFRKDLKLSANQTSLFVSTGTRFSDVVSGSMLIPREVFWEVGMPRNDYLVRTDETLRQAVREKLGLKTDEKLILFAPTYRKPDDNYFKESIAISYGVDVDRVIAAMEKRFGGKWKFAFRFHPRVINREELPGGNCMDLSDYPDMQELLCAADAMINDFSSSMWDFMMTGRPSFLFAVDLEHYVATTQVYTPVSQWPFPQAVNNDQLEANILNFDEKVYQAACDRHYQDLGGNETGEATKLVCQRIYEQCQQ
ncbi:MAG: CDP-glycerol glycerophosphotransferase [Ruminococcaceae bacterium]|nr:CDP-glycerol glycerophosphotransferase [Oscillospiraceae bacterium]